MYTLIIFIIIGGLPRPPRGNLILDVFCEIAPLLTPVKACRDKATQCTEKERNHEQNIREQSDSAVPRHFSVEPHRVVICVEVTVVYRVLLKGAAGLRAIAVSFSFAQPGDARQRILDVVVKKSVVDVVIFPNSHNLAARLH